MDFTTLANAREYLGVKTANDDNLIDWLIKSATAFITNYLSRDILSAHYTEYRDGAGGVILSLLNSPVTAIATLEVDGVAIPLAASTVAAGYTFNDRQIYLRGYQLNRGFQNVKIVYTAGYAAVPDDLQQACLELVAFKYRSRDWTGQSSKIIGGENVTYITKEIPDAVLGTLKRNSRVAPI